MSLSLSDTVLVVIVNINFNVFAVFVDVVVVTISVMVVLGLNIRVSCDRLSANLFIGNCKSIFFPLDTSGPLDELSGPDEDFQAKEVDRSLLKINEKLGNGQFGIVYQGILCPHDSQLKKYAPRLVAVKSLKCKFLGFSVLSFLFGREGWCGLVWFG